MKKLLMLGTSYGTCEMLRYAKSIGVHTIVTDYNEPEHSLGKQISDEYWMINTGDLDTLEAKCREEGVNAVVCGISEFNLEMCMELCRRLGLPCYCTPEAWHFSRDKDDFKRLARSLGAPLPERNGSLITTPSDADQGPWPAISIRLPVAQDSRFLFSSLCLSRQCRYTGSELQDISRRYLAGDPCAQPGDVRRNCKLKP